MKYLLLIYANPTTWQHPLFLHPQGGLSSDEAERLRARFHALLKEITESGELVGGEPLAAPALSRTVRKGAGAPAVTDGPFAETKEQLAGYFLLDCASLERATEIAARFPDAEQCAVEVRPLTVTGP
ncbi:Uncharacterized conserved protein [Amycolatopsis marina]|uniref:Uncharacterized conserved protein n=1 Tax=Amycolatopsis marina TaxID=490629 RepID=A0A1I0YL15_9PSEU|nr:YciI family protein [Amycolatopsis marina]SFB14079.1 Uncharacterized conserved protein [Amycolatopsis marina]